LKSFSDQLSELILEAEPFVKLIITSKMAMSHSMREFDCYMGGLLFFEATATRMLVLVSPM
jgi:hypothetical protein